MNMVRAVYIGVFAVVAVLAQWDAYGGPLDETRYCGVENIRRDADGSISRRADVLRTFRKLYACPSTKLHTGPCPGWSIDHPISLAVGGCDVVSNLQWLPDETKTCRAWYCKDRWERQVYRRIFAGSDDGQAQ